MSIPVGSLVCTGFGDAVIQFRSPAGVALPFSGSLPVAGPGDKGVVTLDDGTFCFTGNKPPFQTAASPIEYAWAAFDALLAGFSGDDTSGGTSGPPLGATSNYTDHFYCLNTRLVTAFSNIINGIEVLQGNYQILKINASGNLVAAFDLGFTDFPVAYVNAVSPDEAFAYYCKRRVTSDPVKQRNIAGSSTTTFTTETGFRVNDNCIVVMRSGDVLIGWHKSGAAGYVKRYNSSGVLQQTYTLTGTNPSPAVLAPGLTDSTFWVAAYTTSAATFSGVRFYEIDITTGTVLNTFDPNDGTFEFDGPFAVVRAPLDIIITPPPSPPPSIPHIVCAPASTILTSPNKTAGCNPGGTGWTATYTGGSGTVPVGADPVDGETLTGKSGVHVWAEFTHTAYPAETVETLRYAMTDLDDTTRKEGRLLSIGDIEYALSDGQGNMTAGTVDVHISDLDGRPIGTRLEGATTKYFERDEVAVFAISTTGRRTGATPRRVGRGLLQSLKYGTPAVVDFSAVDPFFCDGGAFGPDKKVPSWTIPPYYLNAPVDVYAKFLPIIIGEKSDEGAIDPVTNLPSARGVCPLTFVGMDGLATGPGGTAEQWGRFNVSLFACYAIIGLYGSNLGGGLYGTANATSDGATPSVVTLGGSPDLSSVATDGSVTLTLYTAKGRTVSRIMGVSGSTVTLDSTIAAADATNVDWIIGEDPPARVKIDLATRNGQDCMVFGYPNYVRSTTYEDIMGSDGETYRVQDIWVRGPLLDDHLAGIVTLAANVIGVEDRGDGTGLPITDYFTAYNWFIENCILVNSKQPKAPGLLWPQTDSQLAVYADGTYMVRGSSFVAAQAASAIGFGGDGLKVNAYFGAGISTRDAIQLWNDNGGCKTGINEHGQVFVWLLDRTEDTSTWPRIEHVNRVFGSVQRDNPQTEIENVTQGSPDWEPDAERYRSPLQQWPSDAAIRHNKGIRKYSKSIDGKLTGDPLQFSYILQQRLAYAQDGPVYVTFTGDIGLLDYPVGSGIQFTSPMGPGATVGYVDQPMVILTKRFQVNSHLVTLTCLDVGPGSGLDVMVPSSMAFILDDETGSPGARELGDEEAVPSTAMVLL